MVILAYKKLKNMDLHENWSFIFIIYVNDMK